MYSSRGTEGGAAKMASAATPRILLLLSRAQEFHKMLLAILEKSKAKPIKEWTNRNAKIAKTGIE